MPATVPRDIEPVTFRVAAERQFLQRLTGAGIPAGTAELLIMREWAILAGENDYTTGAFQQITGHPPRRWPSSSTSTARNSPDLRVTLTRSQESQSLYRLTPVQE
jgi:hypothetical protein